ncbi:glycosyltransferase [Actinospica sp.]|uniref:glycosyltransferase n=1 Tax=Actinospica sp. TaxID=1872142 RepID=UPI002C078C4F|nr:glycosyltransferase [Actinospica sp.]HWG25848.1 glycosyltransferase [Actinospica sp.]
MPSTIPGPTLTVVICAYTMDRWDDLTAALASLRRQTRTPDETILVIDHCPKLAERAARELTGARIVPSRGRPGLSTARNTGIAEAHGEILAFLDDDATADEQWAERLLAGYQDPHVLGVGGLIRPRWDRPRPAWFPTEFDWVIGCTYRGMPGGPAPVRNLLGANMSFRRAVLDEIGGFRTDLGRVGTRPLGCEETELCIRATQRHPDGVLLYDPAASVRHHVPEKRATWSYFRARCYAEGLSKAAMTRRTGAGRALSSERAYLSSTIPHAVFDALPGTRAGGQSPATIPALLAGVAVTGAGYTLGRLRDHRADQSPPEPRPPVPDLHADVPELLRRLHEAADDGDLLDAYLAACGIDQMIEDRLRRTSSLLRRTADLARADDRGAAGHAALRGLDATAAITGASRAHRELGHWHRRIRELISVLADLDPADDRLGAALAAIGHSVPARAARLLADAVLRPPACFRSFDQHPRDIDELVDRFAARYPDRTRPLLILGARTSGSYLAPLAAARARALGYRDVTVRTTRPGERLMPGETRLVQRIRHAGGLTVVLDDPPASGRSLARIARAVEHTGFPRDRVVLAYAAFADHDVPKHLTDRPRVTLPAAAWDIRTRLGSDALRRTVPALLPADTKILAITDTLPGIPTRLGHLAVPVTVTVATDHGPTELPLVAEGAGLGYLGRHAAHVADALTGTVPHVHGFTDGILLRERGPREQSPSGRAVPADTLADYVTTRRNALPLTADRSLRLTGREPTWEIGARILAPALGRLGTPLRPLLIDPILRTLLSSENPCIVDGRMLPWLWSGDVTDGWHKTDFDEGSFSHLDLASTDPVYDLAAAAVLAPDAEDKLVARYQQNTGDQIGPARWCVHKLVHAWNIKRLKTLGYGSELAALDPTRIQDRAVQQFFARLYLADLDDEPRGPWCVLDLDGVLEADVLGFPTTSPAGALSLRALRAHGYRVLLATGRPIPDVQDRCANYRLAGAVAEYGAAMYNPASGATNLLRPEHDDALAAELSARPSTGIDPRYRCCVRAYRHTDHGRRTALDPGTVEDVMTRYQVTAVNGDAQTDLLPNGLDKTHGIRALTRLLDGPDVPIALAVGDSGTDVAMLRAADLGLAPANADRPAMHAAGIDVLTRHYQTGLAQAVARLLGHAPGSCPACRAPRFEPAEQALLALLAIPEAGRRGAPAGLLRLTRARLANHTAPAAPTRDWSR